MENDNWALFGFCCIPFIVIYHVSFIPIDILAHMKELMYKPDNEHLFFQKKQTELKIIHVNNSYTGTISFYLVLAYCYV